MSAHTHVAETLVRTLLSHNPLPWKVTGENERTIMSHSGVIIVFGARPEVASEIMAIATRMAASSEVVRHINTKMGLPTHP